MSRIGYVHQEGQLMGWMTTRDLIDYVATYYSVWDADLERRMLEQAELDPEARVASLSPGL